MDSRDPLLPNAGIIARREYRDRIHGPLFLASTVVLMALALMVALAPIGIRSVSRGAVTRIAIVSSDAALGQKAAVVADSLLNVAPDGADPATWQKPFRIEVASDQAAQTALERGQVAGVMAVERLPSRQLDVVFRTNGVADAGRTQLVGFAAIAVGILDWTAGLPANSQLDPFQTPAFRVDSINTAADSGRPLDSQQAASRGS